MVPRKSWVSEARFFLVWFRNRLSLGLGCSNKGLGISASLRFYHSPPLDIRAMKWTQMTTAELLRNKPTAFLPKFRQQSHCVEEETFLPQLAEPLFMLCEHPFIGSSIRIDHMQTGIEISKSSWSELGQSLVSKMIRVVNVEFNQ